MPMDKNLLIKFCEGALNEALKSPYSKGDYTYASNGCILIKVPRIPDVPENVEAPDPEMLEYKEPKKWYPVKNIEMPTSADCPECQGAGRNFCCPECHGDGGICFDNTYNSYFVDCQSCDGSGKVDFCEECNGTGKRIKPNPIYFNGVTFDQRYLSLLSELPDCEIGLISKTSRTPYRFNGGTGIIMPMRNALPKKEK